jgi:hypothetical protein
MQTGLIDYLPPAHRDSQPPFPFADVYGLTRESSHGEELFNSFFHQSKNESGRMGAGPSFDLLCASLRCRISVSSDDADGVFTVCASCHSR